MTTIDANPTAAKPALSRDEHGHPVFDTPEEIRENKRLAALRTAGLVGPLVEAETNARVLVTRLSDVDTLLTRYPGIEIPPDITTRSPLEQTKDLSHLPAWVPELHNLRASMSSQLAQRRGRISDRRARLAKAETEWAEARKRVPDDARAGVLQGQIAAIERELLERRTELRKYIQGKMDVTLLRSEVTREESDLAAAETRASARIAELEAVGAEYQRDRSTLLEIKDQLKAQIAEARQACVAAEAEVRRTVGDVEGFCPDRVIMDAKRQAISRYPGVMQESVFPERAVVEKTRAGA